MPRPTRCHVLAAILVTVLLSACATTSEVRPRGTVLESGASTAPSTTSTPTPTPTGAASAPVPTAAPLPLGRNGVIVYSDPAGDIHSLDPRTGRARLIIGGRHHDIAPGFLPDNEHFTFVRVDEDMIYTAAIDGSGIKRYADARQRSNSEISPDGSTIAQKAEGSHQIVLVGAQGGPARPLPVDVPADSVSWLGNDRLLLVEENDEGSVATMWTVRADGSSLTKLTTPDICCDGSTFAAGGLIAWNSWPTGSGRASVHVTNARTLADAVLPSSDIPDSLFFGPHFSPDGRWISVYLFGGGEVGHQLALLRPDGSGAAMRLGPHQPRNESGIRTAFSPDGKQLLAVYDDGTSWLFDLPSGRGKKTAWPSMAEVTWQRLP